MQSGHVHLTVRASLKVSIDGSGKRPNSPEDTYHFPIPSEETLSTVVISVQRDRCIDPKKSM